MKALGRFVIHPALEFLLDALLTVLFAAQLFLAVCLFAFGSIPLPVEFSNKLLRERLGNGIYAQAESFRISLNGEIDLRGVRIFEPGVKLPIIEAESAAIDLSVRSLLRLAPSVQDVVIGGGKFYIPAVYSADGKRALALERAAIKITPKPDQIRLESFAAQQGDLTLRGTADVPLPEPSDENAAKEPTKLTLKQLFPYFSNALKQRERFAFLTNPTLLLRVTCDAEDNPFFEGTLASETVRYEDISGSNFRQFLSAGFEDGRLVATEPVVLRADRLSSGRFNLSILDFQAQISAPEWQRALAGEPPIVLFAARELLAPQFPCSAPVLRVDLENYPVLVFQGATESLGGAIRMSGEVDLASRSGRGVLKGSVDPLVLIPESAREHVPDVTLSSPPECVLNVESLEGGKFTKFNLRFRARDFSLEGIPFGFAKADLVLDEDGIRVTDALIEREDQYFLPKISISKETGDIALWLKGSVIPTKYNDLLPSWWSAIFKDFIFNSHSVRSADFYVKTHPSNKVAGLVYGLGDAEDFVYRGVTFEKATVKVHTQARNYEIGPIHALTDNGEVEGSLRITALPDPIRGPVSLRYDLKGSLEPEEIASLLGEGSTSETIRGIETDGLIEADASGVVFMKAYPDLLNRNAFDVRAAIEQPVRVFDTPLQYLRTNIFGRADKSYLRDTKFGYADGTGSLSADLGNEADIDKELSFNVELIDADRTEAIQNLPALDDVEDSLGEAGTPTTQADSREEARIDFRLRAAGTSKPPYEFEGIGNVEIRDPNLSSVQLLGPLSRFLEKRSVTFASFALEKMSGEFELQKDRIHFPALSIDGPQTKILARGDFLLEDQGLDMRVSVDLFGNSRNPDSTIANITRRINPVSYLLEFTLRGTLENQILRLIYDPRRIIPGL